MAAKNKGAKKYLRHYAPWYSSLLQEEVDARLDGDELGAGLLKRKRLLESKYLSDSIKLLRKYSDGFDSADGFDLSKLAHITPERIERVRKYAPLIREEIATSHIVVRPRSKASKESLIRHTGQDYLRGRRAFVVHTPDPEKTSVKFIGKGKKPRRIEVQRKVKGGKVSETFFYIHDYDEDVLGYTAVTFEDIAAVVEVMIDDMPNGWYVMVTSNHGAISAPMERDMLVQQIASRFMVYDKIPVGSHKDDRKLADTVIGFKRVAATLAGAQKEYRVRLTARQKAEAFRKQQRAKSRRAYLKGRL